VDEGVRTDVVTLDFSKALDLVVHDRLFLTYVNYIWRKIKSNIWLFTDDCILYRKIMENSDMDKLQMDLNRLGNGRK
jgi:hypothetical protein